jgi:hypothetical protein
MLLIVFRTTCTLSLSSCLISSLIKINRWKFEDMSSKRTRYWYEPEGGAMGKGWHYDKVAFLAYSQREVDTKPVFAFHSELAGEWTNTLQMDPTRPAIGTDQWIPDGISFYTYTASKQSKELQPVWRYWNVINSNTTEDVSRCLTLLAISKHDHDEHRPGWIRDQILFYALPYEI